jgi:hypothetical protein
LCRTCNWLKKLFWVHSVELLGDMVQVEATLVRLETVLISEQDRCTVCVKYTTSMEIFLVTPK